MTFRSAAALSVIALLAGACADWSVRPIFPVQAAGQPVLQEQALLGLGPSGAAAAQLLWWEGGEPGLTLLSLDGAGLASRLLLSAPPQVAREVSALLLEKGTQPSPLLGPLVAARWPEALEAARAAGFVPAAPLAPEPGRRRFAVAGAGGLPLALRL